MQRMSSGKKKTDQNAEFIYAQRGVYCNNERYFLENVLSSCCFALSFFCPFEKKEKSKHADVQYSRLVIEVFRHFASRCDTFMYSYMTFLFSNISFHVVVSSLLVDNNILRAAGVMMRNEGHGVLCVSQWPSSGIISHSGFVDGGW